MSGSVFGRRQHLVSRTIRTLERELNQPLFYRDGHGVRLMPSALVLVDHTKALFRQLALTHSAMCKDSTVVGGRVRIGIPPTLGRLVGRPVLSALLQAHPNIKISLHEALTVSLIQQLERGAIDLAIGSNANWKPGLLLTTIFEEPIVLIGLRKMMEKFPECPQHIEALKDLPLIAATRPNNIRMLMETQMAAHQLAPNVVAEADSMPLTLELVADNIGFAVLPLHTLTQAVDASVYGYRRFEPCVNARVVVATCDEKPLTQAGKVVKEALVNALKSLNTTSSAISTSAITKVAQSA